MAKVVRGQITLDASEAEPSHEPMIYVAETGLFEQIEVPRSLIDSSDDGVVFYLNEFNDGTLIYLQNAICVATEIAMKFIEENPTHGLRNISSCFSYDGSLLSKQTVVILLMPISLTKP